MIKAPRVFLWVVLVFALLAVAASAAQADVTASPATLLIEQDIDDGPAVRPETITNTGPGAVTITGVDLGSASFERVTGDPGDCSDGQLLGAGASCAVRVRFDPAEIGQQSVFASVGTSAGAVSFQLSGRGTQTLLTPSVPFRSFGPMDIGSSAVSEFREFVTNRGSETLNLTVALEGAPDFDLFAGSCATGRTLRAAESCQILVRFDPSTVGAKRGAVVITSEAAPVRMEFAGEGITRAFAALNVSRIDFGRRDVGAGASTRRTVTIANPGSRALAVGSVRVTGPDARRFRIGPDGCSERAVAPGAKCRIGVTFDPTRAGPASAVLRIAHDGLDGPALVSLAGAGAELTLVSRSLVLDARRRLPIALTCAGTPPCTGTLTVATAKRVRAGRGATPRVVTLATGRVSLTKLGRTTVTLKASSSAAKLLRSVGRLPVVVRIGTTSRTMTLAR